MTGAPGLVVLVACDNDTCPNSPKGPWRVLDETGDDPMPRGARLNPYYCAECGDPMTVVPAAYQPTRPVERDDFAGGAVA